MSHTNRTAQENYEKWLESIGAEKTNLKSIDKYFDAKYNGSPEYRLLSAYSNSVSSGKLSPISSFELYKDYHDRIEKDLVGKLVNGIEITGQSAHFLERVFGCMFDPKTGKPRNGVSWEAIKDCIDNPVSIEPIKTSDSGERSFVVVGHGAKISINPDSGILIQTNPWRC